MKKNEELLLHAPIHAFKDVTLENVTFEIFDTPGFGEAGKTGEEVGSENFERLDEIGVVLYLLDYTKLNFSDEDKVLDEILARRTNLAKSLQDRLFFVITKIDIAKSRHNESIPKTKHSTFLKLNEKIPNLKQDSIFVISANDAILARMVMDNVADENATKDFASRIWGLYWEDHSLEECREQAEPFLNKHSYLPHLEKSILNTIYLNREKILFDSLIDELELYIKNIQNRLNTAEGVLLADIKKIEDIEKEIESSKKKSEKINNKEAEHLAQIKMIIDRNLERLQENLLEYVSIETKKIKKVDKNTSKKELNQLLDEVNAAIATVLQTQSKKYIVTLKETLALFQVNLFKEFAELAKKEAEKFEEVLGRKLEINLHPGTFDMNIPSSEEILAEANAKIQRFIEKREKKGEYRVDISSWCEPANYVTRYRSSDTFVINQKEILLHWEHTIKNLNANFLSIAEKLIISDMSKQLKNIENRFNEFLDQYLSIIIRERNRLNNENPNYFNNRLEEIRSHKKSTYQIIEGIENYKNLSVHGSEE